MRTIKISTKGQDIRGKRMWSVVRGDRGTGGGTLM